MVCPVIHLDCYCITVTQDGPGSKRAAVINSNTVVVCVRMITDKMKHESSIVAPELNYHHNKEKEAKLYEDDVPLLLHPDARPFRRLQSIERFSFLQHSAFESHTALFQTPCRLERTSYHLPKSGQPRQALSLSQAKRTNKQLLIKI